MRSSWGREFNPIICIIWFDLIDLSGPVDIQCTFTLTELIIRFTTNVNNIIGKINDTLLFCIGRIVDQHCLNFILFPYQWI